MDDLRFVGRGFSSDKKNAWVVGFQPLKFVAAHQMASLPKCSQQSITLECGASKLGILTSSMYLEYLEKLRRHFRPSIIAIVFSTLGWLEMPDRRRVAQP